MAHNSTDRGGSKKHSNASKGSKEEHCEQVNMDANAFNMLVRPQRHTQTRQTETLFTRKLLKKTVLSPSHFLQMSSSPYQVVFITIFEKRFFIIFLKLHVTFLLLLVTEVHDNT